MASQEKGSKISSGYFGGGFFRMMKRPGFWIFIATMLMSLYIGKYMPPTWTTETVSINAKYNQDNQLFFTFQGKEKQIDNIRPISDAILSKTYIEKINQSGQMPVVEQEYVVETRIIDGNEVTNYYQVNVKKHYRLWSLMPAFVAILLAFVIREPITALLGGIVSGALILGLYDITDAVIIPKMMTKSAASVFVLYLLLLGGILGIWSRTGAAKAFAEMMAKHFVKGPRTAKLVAWLLGVIFHQGGTMSTVLVGTTVKPLADEEKVSHEELSYIVDSTASPIASILPFNAWPGYVQAFIYVSGVSWLATESDRILFFMKSIPLSFYSLLAVTFTLLVSLELLPSWIMGKGMKTAMIRSRNTGQLDAPDAEPLSSKELTDAHKVPKGYTPHVSEFFIPILLIIGISMATFLSTGSPNVRWAFGIALVVAWSMALMRGMNIKDLMMGLEDGLKGVVVGAVILLLAMTIGGLSKEIGGGTYLVELLGAHIPYWILPFLLQLLTMIVSFSTGTSWGTYAVTFPLAMPLAIAVSSIPGFANPELFTLVCFTAVLNGSVYGDQCSPISDTTVLSAMVTGSDLMDHVKTQIIPASFAAGAAALLWTLIAFFSA